MADKKQFLLYKSWAPIVEALSVEQAGILFKAIYEYQMTGKEELNTESNLYPIFCLFKSKFDMDQASYELACERNRKNGEHGGRPKTDKNRKKPNKTHQNPVGFIETQSGHDTDTDIDTDTNKYINNIHARFVPPTVPEVQAYCLERKNNVNAEQFVDFYTSKGWKVGNNPMKDWKACVRTWERNRKDTPTSTTSNAKIHNFQERKYDYAALERMLVEN
jgi:hypothetical protein